MSLKPLKVTTNEAPKSKKSDIKIVEVQGSDVAEYNKAVVEEKNAKARRDTLGAQLKAIGLPEFYSLAIGNPSNPPSSVKLQDEVGETVLLTCQNKYSEFDPEVAEPIFQELGAKIEEHAQFVVKAAFDSSIFLAKPGTTAGDEGKFSTKIYNAYKQAIDRATAQLVRDGLLPAETLSPLSTKQVANVMPDFHERRWSAFPTPEQQARISEVICNTVVLKPVVERDAEAPKPTKAVNLASVLQSSISASGKSSKRA